MSKIIIFLENGRLYFRMSGDNISSDTSDGLIKLNARILFAKWLKANERIFPHQPDENFYQYFYWKAEYYVLKEWAFDVKLFKLLYDLRYICLKSRSVVPTVNIFLKKVLGIIK